MSDYWFGSRKPNVLGRGGTVSCDQPTASLIGSRLLEDGANAADAAVAVGAALNVLQPANYGIGGDAWLMYFDSQDRKVYCIDGSGTSAAAFTKERINREFPDGKAPKAGHPFTVTVPGAVAAWSELHERFGAKKHTLSQLFKPAIELARDGYTVGEMVGWQWNLYHESFNLTNGYQFPKEMCHPSTGKPPQVGQVMRLPNLDKSYEEIGSMGKEAFYSGRIAKAIVDCMQSNGGLLTAEDLAAYSVKYTEPLSVTYRPKDWTSDVRIYETPMNSQAIVTLEAIKILEAYGLERFKTPDADYYHTILEALKLGFEDLSQLWRSAGSGVPDNQAAARLLNTNYTQKRATLIDMEKARQANDYKIGTGRDTTFFCVVDAKGNACSAVASNYMGFGTCWVPEGCGFTLHNRGNHFWEFMHGNINPNIRPFHTLCAGILTTEQGTRRPQLLETFGCMGGQNQPQGHLQVLLNQLHWYKSPQGALDQVRIMTEYDFASHSNLVYLENGPKSSQIAESLGKKGHQMAPYLVEGFERGGRFGRGHVISCGSWWDGTGQFFDDRSVLWAAADPRSDGLPVALQ